MANISISRTHDLGEEGARETADAIARRLASEYDIEHHWQDGMLLFRRSGVEGVIQVSSDEILVEAKLGFMMAMFSSTIEEEIDRHLDRHFG